MAKTLGRSVEELEASITYREYAEWLAFLNMEDWRSTRQEVYLARIAHILLMVNGDKKTKFADLFLDDPYHPKKKESNQQELWHKLNAWGRRHNKVVGNKGDKAKAKPPTKKPVRNANGSQRSVNR